MPLVTRPSALPLSSTEERQMGDCVLLTGDGAV